jgi:hypothetical protein
LPEKMHNLQPFQKFRFVTAWNSTLATTCHAKSHI